MSITVSASRLAAEFDIREVTEAITKMASLERLRLSVTISDWHVLQPWWVHDEGVRDYFRPILQAIPLHTHIVCEGDWELGLNIDRNGRPYYLAARVLQQLVEGLSVEETMKASAREATLFALTGRRS